MNPGPLIIGSFAFIIIYLFNQDITALYCALILSWIAFANIVEKK